MAIGGTKVAAGALLAGTAALAGTGVWWLSFLTSVSEDGNSYSENSIGKKYGKYFLSSNTNKWEWGRRFSTNKDKFQTLASTANTKGKFKTAEHGYGDDATKSLNKLCDDVYKLTTTNDLVDDDTENKYTKSHIWKFCGLYEVVTLEKDTDNYKNIATTTIGGESGNKKIFVSTKNSQNDWFWKIKFDEFISIGDLKGKDKSDNEFKKLKDKEDKSRTKLKNACEQAYQKTIPQTKTKRMQKCSALLI